MSLLLLVTSNCKKDSDNSSNFLPSLVTNPVPSESITKTTATCGGNINSDNGYVITQRGVCWSTKSDPTILDFITINGQGSSSFTSDIKGLIPGTQYYVRAYAINSKGTSYGSNVVFMTDSAVVLTLQPDSAGKDVYIDNHRDHVNNNYGTAVELSTKIYSYKYGLLNLFKGTGIIRSIFDFNLTLIPDNSTIDSAFLSLYALNGISNTSHSIGDNISYIQRVISAWNEKTVTWNTQPSTTNVNQILIPAITNGYQNLEKIDVTTLVNEMIINPTTSFGFMLKLQSDTTYNTIAFCSSDHTDATRHPKLVIYCNKNNK